LKELNLSSSIKGLGLQMALFFSMTAFSGLALSQYEVSAWTQKPLTLQIKGEDSKGKFWSPELTRTGSGHPLLINFWATWCEPCKEELPSLEALAELEGEDQLEVLAVNVGDSKLVMDRFVRASALKLSTLQDSTRQIAHAHGVRIYPSTLLVDSKGRIRWQVTGAVDWTSLKVQSWIKGLDDPKLPKPQ
jgi:thiol-disulfide isomerase/thioredoxin